MAVLTSDAAFAAFAELDHGTAPQLSFRENTAIHPEAWFELTCPQTAPADSTRRQHTALSTSRHSLALISSVQTLGRWGGGRARVWQMSDQALSWPLT
jgi:hypothetical protein